MSVKLFRPHQDNKYSLIDNYSYDKLIVNDFGRINYVKDGLKFLKIDEDNTNYNVMFYITTVKKGIYYINKKMDIFSFPLNRKNTSKIII